MLEVSLRPPVGSHVALAPPGGRGWMLGQGGGQAGRLMPTLAGDGPHNAASWLVPRPGHYLKQVQGTLSSLVGLLDAGAPAPGKVVYTGRAGSLSP